MNFVNCLLMLIYNIERLDYDSVQIVQPLGSGYSTTIEMEMQVPEA